MRSLIALTCLIAFHIPATGDNWPTWRGITGQGHSNEETVPLNWSTTENVKWKVPLPDEGNSSPIVWGKHVFLTQATQKGRQRSLICFDREDGTELWKRTVTFTGKEPTHNTNPYCSASPVTDGTRVVVSHGSAGMYCYDFGGKELWHHDVGPLIHIWGNASSPIIYKDLVILWCGPGERQFLLALNKETGQKVWEHQEPGGSSGEERPWVGSWSTPIIIQVKDRDEMILPVPNKLKAFDPQTGKELWSCAGMGPLAYASAVCSDEGIVLAMSGFHGPALAVRAGGSGDVTKTHRLWHQANRPPQRIGTGVVVGDHAYIINEPGSPMCVNLKTGEDEWNEEQFPGRFWSSPVRVGDRLYAINDNGETFVLAAKPEFKILAQNKLGELTRASPAISDGEIFIRTYKHLWCIGQ